MLQLKLFKKFKWFIEKQKLKIGDGFGMEALSEERNPKYEETVTAEIESCVLYIDRERFQQVWQ